MRRLIALGIAVAAAALTASGQLTITTTSVPPAILGQPYSNVALTSSGDPGPITWSFPEGGPPGFILISGPGTTGTFCYGTSACYGVVVQGTPGQYSFGVRAQSQSTGAVADQFYTLVVENQLHIITTSLPNANASQQYSAQLQGFGGTGQYAWSILNGSLPPGIGLDAFKGSLAGVAPGVNGVYTFTVQLQDQVTQERVTQSLSITVINGISILTTALPNATVNQPYQFQLQGTGQNLQWSVPAGSQAPQGFSLSASGLITGLGPVAGSFNFPVQLVNARAPTAIAFQVFTFLVTLGPLTILEPTLPSATQNVPYSVNLTPSGGIPPYTWALSVSRPPGITIDSSGILSGTPTQAGSFPLLVTLQDSTGASFTQTYTLNVSNAVSITTTSLPNGALNVPYSATLTASAGQLPYSWSIVNANQSGNLPPGLTLDPASGKITGTPTTGGVYAFTVQVADFAGIKATKTLSITIAQPLTITTASLAGAVLNQPYSQALAAAGGVQPITVWSIPTGALPAGLTLNPSTGVIGGTPTAAGSVTFTIQALDSARGTVSKSFTLSVASSPLTISAPDFTASVGAAVSQTVTAAGGVPAYTFTVSAGSLPGGLQLGPSNGVISGTPTAPGTFPVTLKATDADGRIATTAITITVNLAPVTIVVPSNLGSGQQPGITVSIPSAMAGDINGTLGLTFLSSVGGDDQMVRFVNGSRSATFTIPKGSTSAPNVTVVTGTVAGTITLTASVPGNADVIQTIVIAPSVPVISSVALQQVSGGLNVVVTGYSNTREVSSGSFTFTVSSGNTLSQATLTVPLTSAFATWFGNTASNATGGQFKLTVPFSVTQGSATAVIKVSVMVTNKQGSSAAVSSP